MSTLAAVILTKNEEKNIVEVIKNAQNVLMKFSLLIPEAQIIQLNCNS